jgi:DNA-binding NtrC family response regulator
LAEEARILIVDDDESVRKSLIMVLEQKGYSVDTAENGREAIEKSDRNFYNIALIDIRLPDMEGTQLLTAMKDTLPKMVKIIVTGYPGLENAIEAVNKGADGYVVKPILDMNAFLNTLNEHLKKQQEARKYSEQKVAEYVETRVRNTKTPKRNKAVSQHAQNPSAYTVADALSLPTEIGNATRFRCEFYWFSPQPTLKDPRSSEA